LCSYSLSFFKGGGGFGSRGGGGFGARGGGGGGFGGRGKKNNFVRVLKQFNLPYFNTKAEVDLADEEEEADIDDNFLFLFTFCNLIFTFQYTFWSMTMIL